MKQAIYSNKKLQPSANKVSRPEGIHHFWTEAVSADEVKICCWCGKKHQLDFVGYLVMCRKINAFLTTHESCLPSEEDIPA